MSDQYDDGYNDGYIDGQQRISYETDELNHTLKEYILVAECLDELYVRECKKTKELTEQLDLMKGWEKIAQSNGEDKRKYLEELEEYKDMCSSLDTMYVREVIKNKELMDLLFNIYDELMYPIATWDETVGGILCQLKPIVGDSND